METDSSFIILDPYKWSLAGHPEDADIGTYWLNLTLSDGNGGLDSVNLSLAVKERIYLPSLSKRNISLTIEEDTSIWIHLQEYFKHLEFLEYHFELAPLNFNYSLDGYKLSLIPYENWNGNEMIKVKGIFGETILIFFVNITVTSVNDRPCNIEIISVAAIQEGELLTLDCSYFDPDIPEGDYLLFRWESDISGLIGENPMVDVYLPPGVHQIALTITDSGGLSNSTIKMIEVLPNDGHDSENILLKIAIIVGTIILILCIVSLVIFLILRKKVNGDDETQKNDTIDNSTEKTMDELFIPEDNEMVEQQESEGIGLSDIP
jgi:hypothetical protein